jgi:hypothetical protein
MKKYFSLVFILFFTILGSCKTAPDYVVSLGQILVNGKTWTIRQATYGTEVAPPNEYENFTITFTQGGYAIVNPDNRIFIRRDLPASGSWTEMSQKSILFNTNGLLTETSKVMGASELRLEYRASLPGKEDVIYTYYLIRK